MLGSGRFKVRPRVQESTSKRSGSRELARGPGFRKSRASGYSRCHLARQSDPTAE